MAARAIAATLFVLLFGFVLAIPVLQSGDPSRVVGVADRGEPEESEEPEASARPNPERADTHRVNIPFDCTGGQRPAVAPDRNLVAAVTHGGIAIVRPDGSEVARVDGSAPLGFSPSGTLATGGNGNLWFPDGTPWERGEVQMSLGTMLVGWGWSPVSDCAATIDQDGGLALVGYLGIPPGARVTLFERGAESFAFSPDGRWLAAVIREHRVAQIWLVNLRKDKVRLLKQFRPGTCCVTLGGWTPSQSVLYWAGPGVSVMADGWPLRSIFVAPRLSRFGTTLPRPEVLVGCGRRILEIDLQGRLDPSGDLVQVYPRRRVVSRGDFSGAACSETGAATAAVEQVGDRGRLVLIREQGGSVLTDDPGYSDSFPEWGPPGTGVLFLRHQLDGNGAGLWFIPEGGTATAVGLRLKPPTPYYRDIRWGRVLDWSATPPTGLPVG